MRPEASPARSERATTVGSAVRQADRELRQVGVDSSALDARMLVAAAAGLSPLELLVEPERELSGEAAATLTTLISRRRLHEPVSRILGRKGFFGRDFALTPDVLDPRPDSEILIEAALSIATEEGWNEAPIRILDIGTGSGCLLVTLLAELPRASGVGTDVSGRALAVAEANARRHGVAERAAFQCARSLEGIEGPFDLIVSNPPYIPSGEIALLEPEVRTFDPKIALDGGNDGLMVYREILAGLSQIRSLSWILFEVGRDQTAPVTRLIGDMLPGESGRGGRTYCDLAGRTRCVAWKARV